MTILKVVLALSLLISIAGCDPEGHKNCDWVLEPEPSLKDKVDPGYIPVCARNRVTLKQDCRMQTTIEYAKKVFKKKFRYVDLRIDNPGLPRTISNIKFCDEKQK
jgi:hypothetical protein